MGKRTTVIIFDDISGEEDARTHTFSVDGYKVSLELTDENFQNLLSALKPWALAVEAGRKDGSPWAERKAPKPSEMPGAAKKAPPSKRKGPQRPELLKFIHEVLGEKDMKARNPPQHYKDLYDEARIEGTFVPSGKYK